MIQQPWFIGVMGILFCLGGLYSFSKNVFEEGRSIKWPLLLLIMGVILIGYASASHYKLI